MARSTYLGGSTIIGPRSGWFGNGGSSGSNFAKKKRHAGSAKKAAVKTVRKNKMDAEKALRSISRKPQSPEMIANRLNRRMHEVEVHLRKKGGELIVIKRAKTQPSTLISTHRPRLTVKKSTDDC